MTDTQISYPVIDFVPDLAHCKGEVGIEIELEGRNLIHSTISLGLPEWKHTIDHSLRGDENAEYVLRSPISFSDVPQAVNSLFQRLAEQKAEFDDSNRTSVHVHLNFQHSCVNRIAAFAALFFSVEEILTEWCGEHRVGNLFCLRAKDAPAIVTRVRSFIRTENACNLPDGLHYANFNLNAIRKFGSIEIRSMRGPRSPEEVINWVSILERLYRLSEELQSDPRQVCYLFSSMAPLPFLSYVLGPVEHIVRQGVSLSDDALSAALYRGIRLAQDICYSRDWDTFTAGQIPRDVFGRKTKKKSGSDEPAAPQPVPAGTTFNEPLFEHLFIDMSGSSTATGPNYMEAGQSYSLQSYSQADWETFPPSISDYPLPTQEGDTFNDAF